MSAQRARIHDAVVAAIIAGRDDPVHTGALHDDGHVVAVRWTRLLLRLTPSVLAAGAHVRPWTAAAAARRRCGHFVRHCWHPVDAMLQWCCCVCGADREHAGPGQQCRLCAAAVSSR